MGTIILGEGLAQALVPSASSYQLGEADRQFLGTNRMRYIIILFFRRIKLKGYVLRCLYPR